MAAASVREYLQFGNIKNSVNFPSLSCPMGKGPRLCVAHLGTVDYIKQLMLQCGVGFTINTETSKNLGYAIIDFEADIDTSELEEQIAKREGTVLVRRIPNG
jgi:D-3-phosphoglycerate dehydrogenase